MSPRAAQRQGGWTGRGRRDFWSPRKNASGIKAFGLSAQLFPAISKVGTAAAR